MAVGSPLKDQWQRNVFAENKVIQNVDSFTGPEYLTVNIAANSPYSETFDFFNYKYMAIFVEDTLDADEIRFLAHTEDSEDETLFYSVYNIAGGEIKFSIQPTTRCSYVADDEKSPKLKSLRWLKMVFYKNNALAPQTAQTVKLLLIG
jgi:hypothetical protein